LKSPFTAHPDARGKKADSAICTRLGEHASTWPLRVGTQSRHIDAQSQRTEELCPLTVRYTP
jgi:hypothetical protein